MSDYIQHTIHIDNEKPKNTRMHKGWLSCVNHPLREQIIELHTYGIMAFGTARRTFHNDKGPAIRFDDGSKEYWYFGEQVNVDNDKAFEKYLKYLFLK